MTVNRQIWMALAAAALMTAAAGLQPAAAAGRERCIGDWAIAATVVKQRQMIDVASLSRLAREKYNGRIMSARLCKEGTRYVYYLVIRGADNRVHKLQVDAKQGSARGNR